MGLVSEEVVVTGTGHVYMGDVDTAFPDTISDPVDVADWVDLGYCSPDGAKFAFSQEFNNVMAWQARRAIRKIPTTVNESVEFDLLQWNQHTLSLGLGGGTVTEPSPGEYEYAPPSPEFINEKAFIVEGADGDKNYRFCIRKGINSNGIEFAFVRENPVHFPIKIEILDVDGEDPWFLQTDDANIGELAEAGS